MPHKQAMSLAYDMVKLNNPLMGTETPAHTVA